MEIEKRVYNAVKKEYQGLNRLCKIIQQNYNSEQKTEIMHEDILPLLNVLDIFDGLDLY